jgi:hypothetical protein
MATRFSDEVFSAMQAEAPLNMEKATAIAEEFGEKPRAIIAAAIRAGIEYQRKGRVRKDGSSVESKRDLVASLASILGTDVETFAGLEKANAPALAALRDAVKAAAQ